VAINTDGPETNTSVTALAVELVRRRVNVIAIGSASLGVLAVTWGSGKLCSRRAFPVVTPEPT
jgi:hypothetical protein